MKVSIMEVIPHYNENDPLQRTRLSKAIFQAWIALNFIITVICAVAYYCIPVIEKFGFRLLSYLVIYVIIVIIGAVISGCSFLIQKREYEKSNTDD